ncbi:hypothetical protein AAVH_34237, partial [Aphelenchoides avenae]
MSLAKATESKADRILNEEDAVQKATTTRGGQTNNEGDAELRALEQKRMELLQQWSEMAREEGEISDNESPESPDNSAIEAYLPEQPVVRDLWRFRRPPTRPRTPIVPLSRAESVERALDVDAFNTSGDLDLRLCAPSLASSSQIDAAVQQETMSRPSSTGYPSSAAEFIALRTSYCQPISYLPAPPTPPPLLQNASSFHTDGLSAQQRTANVDGLDRSFDNYETVCMDIESDSESTSRGAAQQAADDEAEALRQLLLSQVSKKKPTDTATPVPPATHCSEVEAHEPGELPGSPGTAVSTAKEQTRRPTSNEVKEKDRSRKKSTTEKPPSIDLKQKRNAARDQLKKLDELRDSVSFYQEKRQAAVQRKQRLMEQLNYCDEIINDHDKELSRLMDSVAKLSKDIAKSHVRDLLEVEEERDRFSNKRKSSEKPPRKSSKKPRTESPTVRERDAVPPSTSSFTDKRNERERSELLSPDKRSRRSYSRDSVNVAMETASSRREKTCHVSSKLLEGRSSKEVDNRAPRPSWIAEQLDLNHIVNEPAEAEAAEAEMLRRLMARQQQQQQQPLANDVQQSAKARTVHEAGRNFGADESSRAASRMEDVDENAHADKNRQQQQPQRQIVSNELKQSAKPNVDEARLNFDFDASSGDDAGMDVGDETTQTDPTESSQIRALEPAEPLPVLSDVQIAENDAAVTNCNELALQNGHPDEETVHRPSAAEFFEEPNSAYPFEAVMEDRNPSPSNSEAFTECAELPLTSLPTMNSPLFA